MALTLKTPLLIAIKYNSLPCVEILLSLGASLVAVNVEGRSILRLSARVRSPTIVSGLTAEFHQAKRATLDVEASIVVESRGCKTVQCRKQCYFGVNL